MKHENWNGFKSGVWQDEINVRDFIQQNYTEYKGDDSFLAEATSRTKASALTNSVYTREAPNRLQSKRNAGSVTSSMGARYSLCSMMVIYSLRWLGI